MKNRLLKLIKMASKGLFYGIMLQCFFLSFLWAEEGNAQAESLDNTYIHLSKQEFTVKQLLDEVEQKTAFHFVYTKDLLATDKIALDKTGRLSISDLLKEISKKTSLKFKQVNETIYLGLKNRQIEAVINTQSKEGIQTRNITGKVTSMEDGEGLPGVNVVEKGTSNGTVTNVDGEYNLTVSEGATLAFSSVGFTQEEVEVGNRSVIDLTMTQDIQQLQELVVVGYGTQKKSDLTGSVASVKSDAIEKQGPKTTLAETLQGVVPGLNLTQNTNTADQSSFNIQIRGRNSITANNSPLIILDGVPYSGGLNEINQNDIESIDVLKDASSTAIYGSRGANGVIIITTKKGEVGKPRISYNGSYGIKQIYNMPPLMNGEEHYNFSIERYGEDIINGYPTRVENYQNGVSTDWVDLATRNGNMQQHTMNLEGGFNNVRYYLSGSYNDVEGVAVGDDFTQYIGRANIQVEITDWLEVATNTQYTFQDLTGVEASFASAFFMLPLLEPYNEDGSIALRPWPEEPNFTNPLSNLNILDEQFRNRLFSNNYIKIDFPFIKGLSYKFNIGITNYREQVGRYWGPETIQGLENNGIALTQNSSVEDLLYENILTYNKSINDHNFNFTALYSTQKIKQENQSINSRNFPTHVLTWYQHNVAELIEPSSSFSEQNYVSQMARLNYSYEGRYLITATVRRDGYSGFGEDDKYGVFPSIAFGWNLGDESFLSQINWLDQFKLRLSYGENGNQAINPYQTMATLEQMSYLTSADANITAPGYFPANLSNPNLGWETSRSTNVGFDFEIFEGRVGGSFDYYYTNTFDLLLNRAISSVHGITSITQNIGETKNRGFEINLNTINIDNDAFRWNSNLNLFHNNNEIVDLYGNNEDDIANGWFIGESIDANFGYVFDGVWQLDDDIDNSHQPQATPGDVNVKDTNNDGQITPEDRTIIGQTNPNLVLGFSNFMEYKNFSLNFVLFSQLGVTRVNPLWDTDLVWSDARRNTISLNYWSEDNPTNAYPRNEEGANPFGVRFYQNANFLRLRDVTLAYQFDQNVLDFGGLSNLRIFFNIRNALTFTDWIGLDPELADQRNIPLDRAFLLGINLGI